MQITNISLYSIKTVLKDNVKGILSVGYTVRPGFSNGLFITNKREQDMSRYIGFNSLKGK